MHILTTLGVSEALVRRGLRVSRAFVAVASITGAAAVYGADASADVQRLQQQRQQQQSELQLKMQQQLDRAARAGGSSSAEFQRRQIERDQLQRQWELHEQQARELLLQSVAGDAGGGELQRGGGGQPAAEQARRLELDRRNSGGP
jgi:hypothetical protein